MKKKRKKPSSPPPHSIDDAVAGAINDIRNRNLDDTFNASDSDDDDFITFQRPTQVKKKIKASTAGRSKSTSKKMQTRSKMNPEKPPTQPSDEHRPVTASPYADPDATV